MITSKGQSVYTNLSETSKSSEVGILKQIHNELTDKNESLANIASRFSLLVDRVFGSFPEGIDESKKVNPISGGDTYDIYNDIESLRMITDVITRKLEKLETL